MHVVVVFLEARREHAGSLRAALMLHARNCLEKEPGCRRYEVSAAFTDSSTFPFRAPEIGQPSFAASAACWNAAASMPGT